MDDSQASSATTFEVELTPPTPSPDVGTPQPDVIFKGNNYDLMSVVGVTIAGVMLFICATCNMGFYCLPLFPLVLGIIGLLTSKEAADPDRTRLLSWISIGVGGAIVLLIALIIVAYAGFIIFVLAMEGSSGL